MQHVIAPLEAVQRIARTGKEIGDPAFGDPAVGHEIIKVFDHLLFCEDRKVRKDTSRGIKPPLQH